MTVRMRPLIALAVIGILALVLSAPCFYAQTATDVQKLLDSSIEKFRVSEQGSTRLTYRILEQQTNFNSKGKKTGAITRLSEMLYLSGRPYVRLLAINGNPLSGKALKAEQRRYDEAIKRGNGFTEKQRFEQSKGKYEQVNVHFHTLLTDYDNRAKGTASIDDINCVVVDSMPKPGAPQRHVTLWIDPDRKEIVKVAFDLLADEGDLKKGSSGWMLFQPMDGAVVMVSSHVDYQIAFGSQNAHPARLVKDSTMSDFHRFGSTSTILPGSTSPPPQP